MKCPHCSIHFHDNWVTEYFDRHRNMLGQNMDTEKGYWAYRTALCPGCANWIIDVALAKNKEPITNWRQIWPIGANRGPVPAEVQGSIAQDYIEACNVLATSAKASAAL